MKNRRELITLMDLTFKEKTFTQWEAVFRANDVWHCRVNRIEDVTKDVQANAIASFASPPGLEEQFRLLGSPVQLSGSDQHGPQVRWRI